MNKTDIKQTEDTTMLGEDNTTEVYAEQVMVKKEEEEKYMDSAKGEAFEAALINRNCGCGCGCGNGYGYGGGCGGYGGGYGGFGCGGGVVEGLLFGSLLGGRGFGCGGDYGHGGCGGCGCGIGGCGCEIPTIMNDNVNSKFQMMQSNVDNGFDMLQNQTNTNSLQCAIHGVERECCNGFLQDAIEFGRTNTNIVENRYAAALGDACINSHVDEVKYANAIGDGKICGKIADTDYHNLLGQKDLMAQMCECCCKIEKEGFMNTQKILDKLCCNKLDEKNDEIQRLRFGKIFHELEELGVNVG